MEYTTRLIGTALRAQRGSSVGATSDGDQSECGHLNRAALNHRRRSLFSERVAVAAGAAMLLTLQLAFPAEAAGDLNGLIDSIRAWVAGLLAGLAILFLTIGGVRYLAANGNPRAVEEGKNAIKSAVIGYALAALSPMLVDILRRVLGT